jgi:hypothetical protein
MSVIMPGWWSASSHTLEPGGIRTNWARRAGQNAPDLLADYEPSVGPMLKLLQSHEGRSEGG